MEFIFIKDKEGDLQLLDITVVILTKNESDNIEKCLNSFGNLFKRFVIVDSFSDDDTKEKCISYKKKSGINLDFYENKFINYSKQFNWALNNTEIKTEWVFRIDADEELTQDLKNEITKKIPNIKKNITGISMKRRMYFMGKWIKHGGMYPVFALRLFRKDFGFCEARMMDEHIVITEGETLNFEHDFIDKNNKDLEWWINKHNWYSHREMLDYFSKDSNEINEFKLDKNAIKKRKIKNGFYYKLPLFLRSIMYFIYRYFFKLGFMDGRKGFIYHFMQALWYRLLVDAKIFEHNKLKNTELKLKGSLDS